MIIDSLLDTDLYKFTMMQVVFHHFPGATAEYRFKCRNPGVALAPYAAEIAAEIDHLCRLRFREQELDYLRSLRYIKDDFVDLLGLFRLNTRYVTVTPAENGDLDLIIRGPWLHTILFEVPILAIINEVYFRHTVPQPDYAEGEARLAAKIKLVRDMDDGADFRFSDFGTRRRFSGLWQEKVVEQLAHCLPGQFTGTSNVLLAMRHQLIPIGTMAHEYLQAGQALGPRLRDSQVFMFETWAKEYRGDLGIALSDVLGFAAFLRDFDLYFCKLFDGARHDSGDPFDWGERLIRHYESMRIDPRSKTMVFSDGLTMSKAIELYRRFKDRARPAFGIGTHLTNDLGPEALQIVIKLVSCNGQPVAKLSDSPGKTMCRDEAFLSYLRHVFEVA